MEVFNGDQDVRNQVSRTEKLLAKHKEHLRNGHVPGNVRFQIP